MDDYYIKRMNEKNLSRTIYGQSIYSNLWYVDNNNKICFTFTPRAGCSITFQQYLDMNELLKDAFDYSSWIHDYRCRIIDQNTKVDNIQDLINDRYDIIKFITNPYVRAVSIYRLQSSHDLSFREYLKQLVNNEIDYFNGNDKYHLHPQYIDGEESVITKYIKIDKV
jgi:hypothetical protein